MINLLEVVRRDIDGDLDKIGGILGETNQKTEAAIVSSVSAILVGLGNQSIAFGELMQSTSTREQLRGNFLVRFSHALTGHNLTTVLGVGSEILKKLFATTEAIATSVSHSAGIAKSSARSMLHLLAPVIVHRVDRYIQENNLDSAGVTRLLHAQPSLLVNELPTEIAKQFGIDPQNVSADSFVKAERRARNHDVESETPQQSPA